MEAKVSPDGQIVIPSRLRRQLGIRAGDPLEASVEAGRLVFTPRKQRAPKTKIITDPRTGLPVLTASGEVPVLTSMDVEAMLLDFP